MKNIIVSVFSLFFFNCAKTKEESNIYTTNNHVNSEKKDSVAPNRKLLKSPKTETSPIKIVAATLSKNRYSDHKDIKVVFKNTGKKNIKAIKLEWFCINSFDEPANGRYFYGEGRFKENSVNFLKAGETRSEFWEDFSTDANKVTKIRAYYIVYDDGTKWEFYPKDSEIN